MKNNELSESISTQVAVANTEDTVGQVLKKIKENDWDETQYVFVTDVFNRLKGYFEFHKLLKCDPSVMVIDLMQPCHPVHVNHSMEYIASHAIHKNISAVPVTTDQDIFLGIIPPQIVMETLRSEHIEDMLKIAGIQKETALAREAVEEAPIRSARHRLPWLLVGLAGSFISTFLMAGNEAMLNSYITLSFFVPGIVYLADAIGTQTETIVIRGLSLSLMGLGKIFRIELWTGMLIGLVLAALSFPVAMLIARDIRIALVVSGSIVAAGTVATSLGLGLPWLLQRFSIDPAFGSGPLATIIQDILSILIYLMMARVILA